MSLREGVAQLVVFDEEYQKFRQVLRLVHTESRARSVLLIGSSGQLIADWGDTSELDVDSFCSLTAANIAATATLATLVGEDDFTLLFHQGKEDSIHISLIGEQVILAVIFGKEVPLGLVRLRVRKAGLIIQKVVDLVLSRMKIEDRLDMNPLCEITEQDIDELFSF